MNVINFWIPIVAFVPFSKCSSEDSLPAVGYAFSTFAIQRLVVQEQRILPMLIDYLTQAEKHLGAIKRYTERMGLRNVELDVSDTQEGISDEIAGDPVKYFQLVQGLAQDLPVALEHLKLDADLNAKLLAKLHLLQNEVPSPNAKDLGDMKSAILRLQQTFKLPAAEMARGVLREIRTNSGLDVMNLYELGNSALRGSLFTIAFEYFDACLAQFDLLNEESGNILKSRVAEASKLHDRYLANGVFKRNKNPYHFTHSIGETIQDDAYRNKRPVDPPEFWSEHYSTEEVELRINFDLLCRNGDMREPMEKKDLYCETPLQPNFQRLKFEWLNLEPRILQIHDFLSEAEVLKLRHRGEPFLERSGVARGNSSEKTYFGRTSSSTFINDLESGNEFNYISQRISAVTGLALDPSSSEELQIANYSPGGFYGAHYDAHGGGNGTHEKLSPETVNDFLMGKGDRIATFMIYLSDVQAGGGTAFPKLNFAAQPIKRSAIFWYNLVADGTLDKNSLHGGCPILYGSKFIANKWIRSDSQMFIRKCSKDNNGAYNTRGTRMS